MLNSVYKDLLDKLNKNDEAVLLTYLSPKDNVSGNISNKLAFTKGELSTLEFGDLHDRIIESLRSGIPSIVREGADILIEPFYPKPRLIIFGGGHIAKPLSEFGSKVGFSIVVADDRPMFASSARFPEADEVICEDFSLVFNKLNIRQSDFIVIVTRGHRHDGVCLRKALGLNPFYIGMIGSRRRVKAMMEQLNEEGFPKEKLDKVCSPIGLRIGAVTPEEIAISIIAEVISHRRSGGTDLNNGFNWPEFDKDVIGNIIEESQIPRALITIIESKGSTPRKAGAKMTVALDGTIKGSIGGGCSEANILTIARDVIRNKGYLIESVDMTGQAAEDDGMVCGGTMKVLIEAID